MTYTVRTIRYWRRILLANAAGALAVVGISGGFSPAVTWSAFFRSLGTSLVYANCIGTTLATGIPTIAETLWRNKLRARWTILIAAIVAYTALGTFMATSVLLTLGQIPRARFWEWYVGSFGVSIVISLIICIAITAYEVVRADLEETTEALRVKEREEAEARHLATQAQLASLESRVNPHFLFNTLNSIAELARQDPAKAERMTEQLASLMRSSLDDGSAGVVPLEQELRLVKDYLEIERVRFDDRLRYRFEVDPHLYPQVPVPRLSLQTLAENAVKYAVSPRQEGASIVVRVGCQHGRVKIEVEDDGPGFAGANLTGGEGLELIRSRLWVLFGDKAGLHIESRPGRTVVWMDLPFEGAKAWNAIRSGAAPSSRPGGKFADGSPT